MKRLRWLLLGLYIALIALFLVLGVASGDPGAILTCVLLVAFTLATQWLFVLIPAKPECLTPTRSRRLLVPAIIAAVMMTALLGSLLIALFELFDLSGPPVWFQVLFWIALGASWFVWTLVFFAHARRARGYPLIKKMVGWLLAGSVLQPLASVPSHLVVVRRPGCFVGMATALGIFGGLYVMCWAFGPGIVLLFWAETRRWMPGHCPACGYNLRGLSEQRCPECGRPFTFAEIRTTPEDLQFVGDPNAQP